MARVATVVIIVDVNVVVENQTITIPVLFNDSDPNGGYLSLLDVTTASMGDVTLDPTLNTLVYTPDPNQTGTDSFDYTIKNTEGLTATATVFVTVEPETVVANTSAITNVVLNYSNILSAGSPTTFSGWVP